MAKKKKAEPISDIEKKQPETIKEKPKQPEYDKRKPGLQKYKFRIEGGMIQRGLKLYKEDSMTDEEAENLIKLNQGYEKEILRK